MASSDYQCSIRQGYNFEKDAQVLVGHLVSIKVADKELKADTSLTGPVDLKAQVVVGPISSISWQGGYADPVWVSFNVTSANQTEALLLKHTTLSKTDVEFAFNIYAFDQVAKVYYLAFHTDKKALKGLIFKTGGDLAIDIADDPDGQVLSPKNYVLNIGIMPQDAEEQSLLFAVSNTQKFAKQWGVKAK